MDQLTRRTFLRGLAGTPIVRPALRNRRAHHAGERLYHGPIRLPTRVLEIATRAPVYRTTHRHPVIRMALDGVTYVFRTGIAGDCYLGEIVQTEAGDLRVHVWTVIADAPTLGTIATRKQIVMPPSAIAEDPESV